MHESTIATSILDTAIKSLPSDKKKITKISIVAGVMAAVEEECLNVYFSELSKGTKAQGAVIELIQKDSELVCTKCGNRKFYANTGHVQIECEKCQGLNRLEGGTEIYLDSIEIE